MNVIELERMISHLQISDCVSIYIPETLTKSTNTNMTSDLTKYAL